jgi:hypothetical protein
MTAVRRLDAIVAVDFLATRAFMGEDGVGSHLGLRISNLVPKKPSNVRISTQKILTFDGFASPLEVKPGCFPYAFERSSAP